MQSASRYVLHGKQDIRLERGAVLDPPAGQVLVQLRRMGICGTDIHYFRHGHIGSFVPTRPFVLGHEAAGVVVAVAPDVSHLSTGERVALDPSQPCRVCRACMAGRYNLCPRMRYLGSASTTPPTDGVFQEFVAVPASCCYPIPDTLDDAAAALLEPLSVALHAVRQAGVVSGASVLVAGGGAIGQLVVMVARAYGAEHVVLSDPLAPRRSFGLRRGADLAFDPAGRMLHEYATTLVDGGFDIVFEASGAPQALRQALEVARPGATVVQVGSLPAEVTLPANLIMTRELRVVGSFRFANVFASAISLATSGRIEPADLITHSLPLEQFHTAMRLACAPDDVLKVQLSVER